VSLDLISKMKDLESKFLDFKANVDRRLSVVNEENP
jgi:hypothetical protein